MGFDKSLGDTDANETRCPTPKLRRDEPHRSSASASVEPGETTWRGQLSGELRRQVGGQKGGGQREARIQEPGAEKKAGESQG